MKAASQQQVGSYVIQRGVPPPPKRTRKNHFQVLLRTMKRGDSVMLPKVDSRNAWQAARLAFGKGNFTVRKEEDGARIWRLA